MLSYALVAVPGKCWASVVKNNLSSFDLERHADGVNVVVGGGQQGLENNLMVLLYLRIYLPPIPLLRVSAECRPHAAAQICELGCLEISMR